MRKLFRNNWLILFFTPLLLSLAWYAPMGFVGLWIGWVLLLQFEKNLSSNSKFRFLKFWGGVYGILFLWNLLTTWWVKNATLEGAIAMMIANTLLMTFPWVVFYHVKKQLSETWALIALAVFWITFEYAHLNWELSWTWLNLGNGFAYSHWAVQWYEYTGTLGGTLWVWMVSIVLWKILQENFKRKHLLILASTILAPLLLSLIIYFSYQEKGKPIEIVVVQPNIDPYTEKFIGTENFIPYDKQAEILLNLAKSKITSNTQLLLFPETAFDEGYDEKSIFQYIPIQKMIVFLKQNSQVAILGGTTSWLIYGNKKSTTTARYNEQVGFYDVFNTAMFLRNGVDSVAFYHKSKLVPLVESMPYAEIITKIFGNLIIELGGTSGGLGFQKEVEVFQDENFAYAPIICYESIFGEYVTDYVRKGANILCIITNDGWWGDTPGYRQHWQMARLRAIETRRAVARSANTGISGFFNQRGDVIEQTSFWVRDVRRQTLQANTETTWYVRFGDWIGILASWLSLLLFFWALTLKFWKKKETLWE
ncbi:MAG: apolipoprotein N-acyltransferase [Raineya sp.]|nr:apolipoprotein N-acyltransferase [Raineya sp.]